MPNPIKEALLGRGWAGKTLSRAETVEHLNPLVREHIELNHHYRAAIRSAGDDRVVGVLERLQKTARTDVGKLSETVLSSGGTPYNGTDLEPNDFDLKGNTVEMVRSLKELETAFHEALEEELDLDHQMRTRGVLSAVRSNSADRLDALDALIRRAEEIDA